MKKKHILGAFDWFLISGVVACNVIYSIATASSGFDVLGFTAAVAGILCVVLAAKGSIWNYAFGIVQVSLYAYIAWKSTAYGNAAVNALYYFPMQFIGWWQWSRRGAGTGTEAGNAVESRRLSWKMRTLIAAGIAVVSVALAFVLKHFGAEQPWIDSFTTVLCIAAQALMTFAFVEQWWLWIVFNVFTVIMWSVFAAEGTEHSVPTLIMYVFYLMNSVNGLVNWRRLERGDAKV